METLELEEEVEAFTEGVSDNLPMSKSGLETYLRPQSIVKTASVPDSSGTALQDGPRSI